MIITRFHNVERLQLTVEFLTPTFLGGANQNAELRAAPFKSLLRQWWRVAKGSEYDNPKDMLAVEGALFGSVLDGNKSSASQVRLCIAPVGKSCEPVSDPINFGQTFHKNTGNEVRNSLYLGFGPLSNPPKKYISSIGKAELTISFPTKLHDDIMDVLHMIDTFGTIGSRCRNGWGSLSLSGDFFINKQPYDFNDTISINTLIEGTHSKKYPFKLGSDDKGKLLCWETSGSPQDDKWYNQMKILAKHYLELRTSFDMQGADQISKRHILGYPVMNHDKIRKWGGRQGRMPSQLRLMVKRNAAKHLVARILHLPHRLPMDWDNTLGTELSVWQDIHKRLDDNGIFHRCCGGA